jgi:hypothetical protein
MKSKSAALARLTSVALLIPSFARADVTLVADGQPRAAVFVSERVWDDAAKNPEPPSVWVSLKPEDNRRRLRESVRDLATSYAI